MMSSSIECYHLDSRGVFPNPSPWKALDESASTRGKQVSLMPSHNNNFINFIQSTFLFIQRLNAPNQHEKFKILLFRMIFTVYF